MKIRRFKSKLLKNYVIVNYSGWTKSGFYHESILLHYDSEVNRSKINYINRTWECYLFQTSMQSVVSKVKDKLVKEYLQYFKIKFNVTRMTAKNKEQFETYIKDKKDLKELDLIYKELTLYSH